MPNQLIISNQPIPFDDAERVSLNALHHASGLGESKEPNKWRSLKSTKELIAELEATEESCGSLIHVVRGGKGGGGTYAHELLAVSYAGWISPKFQLQVNQAFLQSRQAPTAPVLNDSLMVISKDDMIAQQSIIIETQSLLLKMQQEKLQPKAKRSPNTRLTDDEVTLIHRLKSQGLTHQAIADITKRSTSAISFVLRGAKGANA